MLRRSIMLRMFTSKPTKMVKSYKTVLAKIEYRARGKMLITPPGHPQKLRLLDARINNSI